MMLRLLPPSMSTLEKRVLPMMGSTMSGYHPGCVVGGGVEQLVGVGGMALRKLVHQVPARRAFEEGVDDLDVGDAGELGALLGEALHVVA